MKTIGLEIGDRPRRHARIHRRLGDGGRQFDQQARIEGLGDQIIGPEDQIGRPVGLDHRFVCARFGEARQRMHAGHLHLVVDGSSADIEGAAKQIRETQNVVHLVRIIRTAGGQDRVGTRRQGDFGADFRFGIGEREDQRTFAHLLDHLGLQNARRRQSQEDVGPFDHIVHGAGVGGAGVTHVMRIGMFDPAFVDHAADIADEDVFFLQAELAQQIEAGQRRRTRAGAHELQAAHLFFDDLQRVDDGGADDDRGAMLVVVHDRNIHAIDERALDFEAFGRLDVFEVDAAEGRLQGGDDLDEFLRIAFVDFDIEDVDAGELLKQVRLTLHHRLSRQRADIAEPQNGRPVGDDRDQVAARGDFGDGFGIGRNQPTGRRDAWRIGEREVVLICEGLGDDNRKLTRCRVAVIM